MKKFLMSGAVAAVACAGLSVLTGCGGGATSYVRAETTTLGRVVVYRNGVAYFERYAKVNDDTLRLAVPGDKVDDFLKSLTVVDAKTGEPAPISFPTGTTGGGAIDMKISLPGPAPHQLKVSYVTEAPSWKPSYRVVLGKEKTLDLQAWAVVDNTSGEDWNAVRLGVGSSSAMSFRFDLRSVRVVERETLQPESLFALAPPVGGAAYGRSPDGGKRVFSELTDESIAMNDVQMDDTRKERAPPAMHTQAASGVASNSGGRGRAAVPSEPSGAGMGGLAAAPKTQAPQMDAMARALRSAQGPVIVEGYAAPGDKDKMGASLERANRVREQLVRSGLDPSRVVAMGKGAESGRAGGVRIVEGAPPAPEQKAAGAPTKDPKESMDPIGTSHFESAATMNVARGTSAMVSILHTGTEGEVVYLYDPESARGNGSYPFKAVRVRNPTDSMLESGPVTVFGEGRFIGEGLAEAIPARAVAFVPFALDRQVVVEQKENEHDSIARILTVQRGVFSTELRHTRKSTFTLYNRMSERATVYVRHTVAPGFTLSKAPPDPERIGSAHLFRVEVAPNGRSEVVIEETTPVFKTTDIRTPAGLDLVVAHLSSAATEGPLKGAVEELVKLQKDIGKIEQQIATSREQMGEYRTRMDELHAQLVTLKMVKTAGPLMQHLEKKLQEMSEKMSRATIDVVGLEEKRMVARIHFQDGVADLTLEKPTDADDPARTKVAGGR